MLMLSLPVQAEPLPCLDSSRECLETLSDAAIARSPEIQSIDDRLELVGKQIKRQYQRRWTAFLPLIPLSGRGLSLESLNPLTIIATAFGGGAVRDVDLKIAELEVRVSDMVRRKAEVMVTLRDRIIELVLDYEAAERQRSLIESRITTHQQRVAVLEISYRLGEGSTETMLPLWQRTEELQAQLAEVAVKREQSLRKLLELTGYEEKSSAGEDEES